MSDSERERIRQQKAEELKSKVEGSGQEQATESSDVPTDPVYIHGEEELTDLINRHQIVFADFYADWCGPCQMLEPILESIAAETPAVVAKVDVDANQTLASKRGIRGVPTIFLYADGEEVQRLVGMQQEADLRQLIDQVAG